ncbi:MAG TPA: hypothetical protein VFI49_09540 [Rudaea sp.]|nr:hypothetical protein [Rudaea sp.]
MNVDPDISEEIAASIAQRAPLFALQSTVVAHGLPWPGDLDKAIQLCLAIRVIKTPCLRLPSGLPRAFRCAW